MKRMVRTTGFGSPAESYAANSIDWNTLLFPKPHAMYVFSVNGRGNENYGLYDRDLVIIDCSLIPESGDLVVYRSGGEFVIGRYTGAEDEITGVVSRTVRIHRR